MAAIRELAPAKINLVLRIGPKMPNRLHAVSSLFASLDLADEVVQASFDQNFAEITRKTDPEKGALLVWILCGVDVGFRTVMSLLRRDGGQVSVPSKVALSNGSWIISLLNKKE